MSSKHTASEGGAHQFGGDWTSAKLAVLEKYLSAYTTALKGTPFVKGYIDAFAGTGYRSLRQAEMPSAADQLLFPDLAAPAAQEILDGSARLALKTEPRFDRYVFVERQDCRCQQLEHLREEFPALAKDIRIHRGDANTVIQDLCERNWKSHRAVLFLDPYGMQVEWATIEAVAATKAIDLWLLFPLGIGAVRLLTKSGDIPPSWRRRLDLLLGTTDWYDAFYRVEPENTLFGVEDRLIKASTETIGQYFVDRLRGIFAGVADHPKVLRNSTNCPLYLLCFAAGNARGARVALKIANHLLDTV